MNELDDFLCNVSPEEYEDSYNDQLWYEAECKFCEQYGLECEMYED